MKKIYILLLLVFAFAGPLAAQQQYDLAQYYHNPQALNPAFTGIEKFWQVNVGYRKHWAGSEFAPTQGFVSVNGSFYKPDIRLNAIRISRPEAYEENFSNKEYRKMNARHGIGAYYGYIGNSAALDDQGSITYGYHLPLSRKLNLAAGIGGAFANTYLIGNNYKVRDPSDYGYIRLEQSQALKRQYSVTTGLALYSSKFYLGYSTNRLVFLKGANNDFEDPINFVVHSVAAGYQLDLSPNLRLQPSILMNYDRLHQASAYGNVKLRYRELLWAGVSYRNKEAYGLLAGFQLSEQLSFGYAYEQNVQEFDAAHNANHEVVVGLRLFRKGYKADGYFW